MKTIIVNSKANSVRVRNFSNPESFEKSLEQTNKKNDFSAEYVRKAGAMLIDAKYMIEEIQTDAAKKKAPATDLMSLRSAIQEVGQAIGHLKDCL